ncbi:aquaporin [Microbacterium sp. ASV49]|uniref:Aquaporin n=1 Tax=Microbacterium candidum TaxID=3041922 RepID=A0ABT7N0W8_9MICO|nr:aquaporin [Microbacterium sp. ASV49]MDL9980348.1 aquaporin [Microbacterium sp. ASV49]
MSDSTASPTGTTTPSRTAALIAEAFGSFLLVIGVVATALFAAGFGEGTPAANKGVGFLGVAFAVGLTVVVGFYAFGPISGGHFNPAVTMGLAAAGRFPWRKVTGYVLAQVVGGAIATTVVVLIGLTGPSGWLKTAQDGGFASNGWGDLSPSHFGIGGAIVVELLFTAIFLFVILGVTHPSRGTKLAGLAIGLTLTLIHIATIPIDNTSVNPARSIATAIYGGGEALAQLWVFIVFPIVGALVAGFAYKALFDSPDAA